MQSNRVQVQLCSLGQQLGETGAAAVAGRVAGWGRVGPSRQAERTASGWKRPACGRDNHGKPSWPRRQPWSPASLKQAAHSNLAAGSASPGNTEDVVGAMPDGIEQSVVRVFGGEEFAKLAGSAQKSRIADRAVRQLSQRSRRSPTSMMTHPKEQRRTFAALLLRAP